MTPDTPREIAAKAVLSIRNGGGPLDYSVVAFGYRIHEGISSGDAIAIVRDMRRKIELMLEDYAASPASPPPASGIGTEVRP